MVKSGIECKKKLAKSDIDFPEGQRYHSETSEEEKMRREFLDAISQMLIYYKNKGESRND